METSESTLYKKARAKIVRARILVWAGLGLAIGTTVYFFIGSGPGDPTVILVLCIRSWIGASVCMGVGRQLTEAAQKEYTQEMIKLSYQLDCWDCRFIDREAKIKGKPWCTASIRPERGEDGRCLSREARA